MENIFVLEQKYRNDCWEGYRNKQRKKNECVYFMHLTLNGKYEKKKKVAVSLIYIYRMRLMNLLQKTNKHTTSPMT